MGSLMSNWCDYSNFLLVLACNRDMIALTVILLVSCNSCCCCCCYIVFCVAYRQTLLFSATLPKLLVEFAKAGKVHD